MDAFLAQIEEVCLAQDVEPAFDALEAGLRERRDWHQLFDARLLREKWRRGLPLSQPTSLQDVPDEHRTAVEHVYRQAAREAGLGFLADDRIREGWMYLQVLREPEPVAAALAALPDDLGEHPQADEMIQLALFEGVSPVRGLQWLLQSHGVCNTITTLDQALPALSPGQRSDCAKLLVRTLTDDLRGAILHHIQRREPDATDAGGLADLWVGREWIFENAGFHIDVSHLNSVVRFARSIESPAPELQLARDLADYGAHLDPSLQYPGDPPFQNFFTAHRHFFNALLGRERDPALAFFRQQLEQEPDPRDKPIYAYVLVDLLMRCHQLDEAVPVAAEHLANLGEDVSLSLEELCCRAGRFDVLKQVRREQGRPTAFFAALLHERRAATK